MCHIVLQEESRHLILQKFKILLCINLNLSSATFNVFLFCLVQKPKRTFFGRNPKWKTSKASSFNQWYAWPASGRDRLLKSHPVLWRIFHGNSQGTSIPLSWGIRKFWPIWMSVLQDQFFQHLNSWFTHAHFFMYH